MSTPPLDPKSFHNAFLDTAKRDEDVLTYYVNRAPDQAHDCVAEMKQAIEWEDSPGCYLFSGLRGAGKTTELQRLMGELNQGSIPAFYCSADAYLDLNDPKIGQTELIFTVLAGLCEAVQKRYGNKFLTDSIWDRFKRVMNSNVELKPKFVTPGAEVEFSLHENVTFRQELIQFAQQSSQFFQEANKFAAEVAAAIQQQSRQEKVVLVVDSLERLSAPSGLEHVLFDSLKELFFNNPARLAMPDISVIYTVPPYLHALLPNIDQFYSGTFSLPNFKIMHKPSNDEEPQRNAEGIGKMVEVINRRFADWQRYVSQEVIEEFAWLSGGNVRRMFSLIRLATRKASLGRVDFPIAQTNSTPVQQAITEETKNFHWLNAKDRQWLEHCKNHSGDLASQITNLDSDLPPIIRLFDHSLVLNYQNGSIWYQVPPIIHNHV
ncbi:hypothetical protein QCD60_14395 [Pokkaliibacter sp. MBI-7]|uniref:hypothetical protein n=1 Tax=Pokkaliibacter sp. MBI-7 TaxID=3040600 RepID=UPI002449CD31|nr:hypothetical protein [Pokkaliibacter sp. MBI-7]MDH2433759.1 hypothetical protein [Pokkaliibacter sp. MBI-7]